MPCGCEWVAGEGSEPSTETQSSGAATPKSSHATAVQQRLADWRAEEEACQRRIDDVRSRGPLPGAPEFEQHRSHILARGKGHPVILTHAPRRASDLSRQARAILDDIDTARAKALTLFRNYPKIVRRRALAREVLLRDGYLYADDPSLAFGLSHVVRLEHLFSEERIWVQRGSELLELQRVQRDGKAFYVEAGSDEKHPRRATLLFLDRVSADPSALKEPLHRDPLPLRAELGFEAATVSHLGEQHLVLEARYGDAIVPTLLESQGARLSLVCEALPLTVREEVQRLREQHLAHWPRVERIREAILAQIDERLPFDEPRTEFGQEDGKLRDAWKDAYRRRRGTYYYNEDRYYVFRRGGGPHIPQVCIDFIADTLERASGTWWRPRGEPPGKTRGGIDFDATDIEHRRRVGDFVEFAERNDAWFEVWRPETLVPLTGRRRFFDFIETHREVFRIGDIVIIYGLRDDQKPHYHSFFVFEKDPLSGMPLQLASNAVQPQIRSWEGEMHNAPRRSVRVRIRPRPRWLANVIDGDSRGATLLRSEAKRP